MNTSLKRILLLASLCAITPLVSAITLGPVSYDMNNGNGQATGGQFNYWDKAYGGSGNTVQDNAPLSGGSGDLTNGTVTSGNWFDVENAGGTGPYVGWNGGFLADPSVQFHFAASVNIDTISIHADDSAGAGGVSLPTAVSFEWQGGSLQRTVSDPDPSSSSPSWLVFGNLGITGVSSVRVHFSYGNAWVFVDEVTFAGTVPEPAAWAQLAAGLLVLGGLAARKRR
jgi:hypothetical protein